MLSVCVLATVEQICANRIKSIETPSESTHTSDNEQQRSQDAYLVHTACMSAKLNAPTAVETWLATVLTRTAAVLAPKDSVFADFLRYFMVFVVFNILLFDVCFFL